MHRHAPGIDSALAPVETPASVPPEMAATPVDRSYRALLGVPSLGRILVGMTVARIGGSMWAVAMVLFALAHYGSPAIAGAVGFAMLFPGIVASPVAGALLDRYGRIRLVIVDYLVAGSALGLIGILALADRLPPVLLVAIVAVASLTEPLSASGVRSVFPVIVPEHLWERANAADSNAWVVATLLAPPLAAALVQVWGGPPTLIAIAAVFGLAAAAMSRVPEPGIAEPSGGRLLLDARDGLLYVWHNATLRSLALSISVLNLGFGMIEIAIPVMVLDRFHQPPAVVGAVWAVMAVGGMAATLLVGRVDTRGIERGLIAWPMAGMAVALALPVVWPGIWTVLLAALLVGMLNGPVDIALMTLRQRRTDQAWMGRAFAVSMALNGLGGPFGSLIGGWLVASSLDAALAFGVAASVAAALAALLTLER